MAARRRHDSRRDGGATVTLAARALFSDTLPLMSRKKKSAKKSSKKSSKKAVRKSSNNPPKKAPRKTSKKSSKKSKKPIRAKSSRSTTSGPSTRRKTPSPREVESGDLQELSNRESADSESVDELLEEGNAFEAGVVQGVEEADDSEGREVHTHEVPEDDVPEEYLDES